MDTTDVWGLGSTDQSPCRSCPILCCPNAKLFTKHKTKRFLFLLESCPDNFASEGATGMQLSLTAATVTISGRVSLQLLFQEKKSGDVKLKR